ncbi:MAG: hypothetical protein WC812_00075 [Candidatus Pacearchaeota archaeon]|jgi:hypothetical protein
MVMLTRKRGQVTIFVIIALVLILAVGGFFLIKSQLQKKTSFPAFAEPIETTFLDCLEQRTLDGISILETNGGSLYFDDFEIGSRYMPFSSHLSFMGNEIPYWFYISGNNIPRENIPTKESMQQDLERFIENSISKCDLTSYYDQGFILSKGVPEATVKINEGSINVVLNMDLEISKGAENYLIKEHSVEVKSNLKKLYEDAVDVYNFEQKEFFLENYSVDFLRLYAPVDGVEISCSPKVWSASNVSETLRDAVELNTFALKNKGDKNDYFALNLPVESEVRFITSKTWPYSFEVSPNEGDSLVAKPVGNQEGLGVLGFCYVPYHFVYNFAYPVLIQVLDEQTNEVFQFPVAVILHGNKPRESLDGTSSAQESSQVCEYANTEATITVKDINSKPVSVDVSYECFVSSSCYLGQTNINNGSLTALLPQCINGNFIIESPDYKNQKIIYSSVNPGSLIVSLDREYEKEVSLKIDGIPSSKNAVISFISSDGESQTIVYPESNKIKLSSGSYQIKVYVYENSSIKLGETTSQQCIKVPTAFGSIIGIEINRKECYEVKVPEQIISNVLAGGGVTSYYFDEEVLSGNNEIIINSPNLPTPTTIEELQLNYILYESNGLEVSIQ